MSKGCGDQGPVSLMDSTDHHWASREGKGRCVILGCGGHGRVVLDILRQAGGVELAGFVDSNQELTGRHIDGLEVLGVPEDLPGLAATHDITQAIVAVGYNGVRRNLAEQLSAQGFDLVRAIHPSANVASTATIGCNTVIAAGALVCAHCQIGDSVILNTGCIVDHESVVGTASHVCPGSRIAGRVVIESGAFVGIGATVIQCLRVGCEAVVGAGAVVIEDVPTMATVVGVPARVVKGVEKEVVAEAWMLPALTRVVPDGREIPVSQGR